jgi:hypothetical protein
MFNKQTKENTDIINFSYQTLNRLLGSVVSHIDPDTADFILKVVKTELLYLNPELELHAPQPQEETVTGATATTQEVEERKEVETKPDPAINVTSKTVVK